MKTIKNIVAALAIALLALASFPTMAQTATLTEDNGVAVGKALSSLYSQFKSTGTIDIKNPVNIISLGNLAKNLAGFKSTKDNVPFIKGLIDSSKGLVTNTNSSNVLESLGSISQLDLSSLGSEAANNVLSKLSKKKTAPTGGDGDIVASILTNLFQTIQ